MNQTTAPEVRKLLIVDDSIVSRLRIRTFFTAHCPTWTIQEVGSGDEALKLAAQDPPDFVTMDVNMPGMSGYETAQLMLLRNANIRVVVLTANISESSRKVASALRLSFVEKPATEASLKIALAHLLETHG